MRYLEETLKILAAALLIVVLCIGIPTCNRMESGKESLKEIILGK